MRFSSLLEEEKAPLNRRLDYGLKSGKKLRVILQKIFAKIVSGDGGGTGSGMAEAKKHGCIMGCAGWAFSSAASEPRWRFYRINTICESKSAKKKQVAMEIDSLSLAESRWRRPRPVARSRCHGSGFYWA